MNVLNNPQRLWQGEGNRRKDETNKTRGGRVKEEEFKQAVSEQLGFISEAYEDHQLRHGAFDELLGSLSALIYHHTGVKAEIQRRRIPVDVKIDLVDVVHFSEIGTIKPT